MVNSFLPDSKGNGIKPGTVQSWLNKARSFASKAISGIRAGVSSWVRNTRNTINGIVTSARQMSDQFMSDMHDRIEDVQNWAAGDGGQMASQILGGISAVTSVLAVVATATGVGAPLGAVLGGISVASGLAGTAIDCVGGRAVDCAAGLAGSFIPGGKVLSAGAKIATRAGEAIVKATPSVAKAAAGVGTAAGKAIADGARAAADAARKYGGKARDFIVSGAGSSNAGGSLDLKYMDGWDAAQRAAADSKVAALDAAKNAFGPKTERAVTSASSRYRAAGGYVPPGSDVDHVIDLQLGGADDISNMAPLDASVNRSLGAQIAQQLRNMEPGTRIRSVTISDR